MYNNKKEKKRQKKTKKKKTLQFFGPPYAKQAKPRTVRLPRPPAIPGATAREPTTREAFLLFLRFLRGSNPVPCTRLPYANKTIQPRSAPLPRPPSIHRGDIQGVCRCEAFVICRCVAVFAGIEPAPKAGLEPAPGTRHPCGLTSLPLRVYWGGCSETRIREPSSAREYIYRGKWNVAVQSPIIRLKHKPNIGHPTLLCLSGVPPTPVGLYITAGSVHSR